MKNKIHLLPLASLLLAGGILCTGCGGDAPASSVPADVSTASSVEEVDAMDGYDYINDYVGLWGYYDIELWLRVHEDSTFEFVNSEDETIYTGTADADKYGMDLCFDDDTPQMRLDLSVSGDLLEEGSSDALHPVDAIVSRATCFEKNGLEINGVVDSSDPIRLDSGDLAYLSKKARKLLDDAGFPDAVISASNDSSGHGNQKLCSLIQDRILVEIEKPIDLSNVYNTSIKVGQFSSHNICPTCGLATSSFVIGELDDVRYFDHPDHFNADIMWFTKGYVEYVIPNLIPRNQKITQLSLSAEISSEAPGTDNDWPSDISFYINDTLVGTWTSPGDYGDVRGMFTPEWWPQNWNQYGLLKLLVINHKGTFIRFRIAVEEDSAHVGGLTIFGKSFGNYDQDIVVSINYAPLDTEKNTK